MLSYRESFPRHYDNMHTQNRPCSGPLAGFPVGLAQGDPIHHSACPVFQNEALQ
jgi:hypothetical protein